VPHTDTLARKGRAGGVSPARPLGETPVIDLTAPVVALRKGESPKPPSTHLEWATRIAARIAEWRGFSRSSQEAQDIISHALFTLVRKLAKFAARPVYDEGENVHGHFRGWIHPSLRAECLREAKRLRGGGTFHTPPHEELDEHGEPVKPRVIVEGLPVRRTENGIEEVEIADSRCENCAEVMGLPAKRRWDTRTGEEVAEPAPPALTYPAGTTPGVSVEMVAALVGLASAGPVGRLDRAGQRETTTPHRSNDASDSALTSRQQSSQDARGSDDGPHVGH
jgi:hypothetical protein